MSRKLPTLRILIAGGARSGKSSAALSMARKAGDRRLFIATAEASDQEMSERIARHREERSDFETLEKPFDLSADWPYADTWDVIVVDCLTLWISNLLFEDQSDEECENRILADLSQLSLRCSLLILVSNEVGFGIVPEHPLARRFRDLNGRLQQKIAAQSEEIYLTAMGRLLPLHTPVC